jgi:hypothetical protein
MLVRKHGRTTGYTEGEVTDDAYDALVGMDHNDPSVVALFEDQMRIERTPPYPEFGLGGDSGSLVVRRDGPAAVGLYFAGPQSGVYGIANHIQDVLNELEVQLLYRGLPWSHRSGKSRTGCDDPSWVRGGFMGWA